MELNDRQFVQTLQSKSPNLIWFVKKIFFFYQSTPVSLVREVLSPEIYGPARRVSECWPVLLAGSHRIFVQKATISCSNWTGNSTAQSLSNQPYRSQTLWKRRKICFKLSLRQKKKKCSIRTQHAFNSSEYLFIYKFLVQLLVVIEVTPG